MERLSTLLVAASLGALALGSVGLAGCSGQTTTVVDGGNTAQGHDAGVPDLTQVVGGGWQCRIDRKWNKKDQVGLPADDLPESSYEPISQGARHDVEFAIDGSTVSVGQPSMKGQLADNGPARRLYDLQDGTFAGGRFVVWIEASDLGCELTLYGSGLPIVQSERGTLQRAP